MRRNKKEDVLGEKFLVFNKAHLRSILKGLLLTEGAIDLIIERGEGVLTGLSLEEEKELRRLIRNRDSRYRRKKAKKKALREKHHCKRD
jgi:hypothetical protein